MLLGIDHLVIAVADPDASAAELEAVIGLAVTGGGRHEGRGTFNRLAFVGDTYLELIGVDDRALVGGAAPFTVGLAAARLLDAGREGLATYALATDDVAGDVARLRAAGSPIGDAVAGSRARPDGELVRWIAAFPDLGEGEPPFLIEHERAGSEWGPDARAARAAFRHPVGGTVRLAALTLPAADPAALARRYRAVLGIAFDGLGEATLGVRGEVSDGEQARVGEQALRLAPAAVAPLPVVDLVAEAGTPDLDVVRFGVRWRRLASG